ncbi:hypothetical protein A4X03_0g867 [Tilletia caries]|uniref:Uncharacterized protein n=1 Tax=Tilletia caries TaxID=13290 RepID=A0A8T8TPR4_9BASI|nr:hypothetical protein A4X03_0g867 [Tilletia caries]
MKPATTLLTIAAMAFVAQAAPVPLPNAIEMSKFQERAVAVPADGIFDQLSLHHSRSSRLIGGNDYADTLRMKRGGGAEAAAKAAEVAAKEGEAVVNAGEAAAKEGEAVVNAGEAAVKKGGWRWRWPFGSGKTAAKPVEAAAKTAEEDVKNSKPWGWIVGSAVGGTIFGHALPHDQQPTAPAYYPAAPAYYPAAPAYYPPASYPPASKKRDVVDTPSLVRFIARSIYSVKREEYSHNSRSIGGNEYGDVLRIKREEA